MRPALEVDQQERELVGRVGGGQTGHDGPQQLALARAGGADDQPVRADAILRRLLEIEHHRVPGRRDPHRHPEQLRPGQAGLADPAFGQVKEVEQPDGSRSWGGCGWALQPERGQVPGERLTGGEVGRVGPDPGDPAPSRTGFQERREALVVEADPHRDLGRLAGGGLGQPDDRDAGARGPLEQVRARLRSINDDEEVRAGADPGLGVAAHGGRPRRIGWIPGVG